MRELLIKKKMLKEYITWLLIRQNTASIPTYVLGSEEISEVLTWGYRTPITITTAGILTDYVYNITLTSSDICRENLLPF